MSASVAFATLGCRLNQVDSLELQARLESRGFRTVAAGQPADVVIVNTCTVTARAEVSDRQAIRRAARSSPGSRVVVTGCWAQTSPGQVAAVPGVDLVVGNADKHRLPELVERLLADARERGVPERRHVSDIGSLHAVPEPVTPARGAGRSRAFLKVQDGCRHRCAFCVVPLARGPSRSVPPGVVLAQARRLAADGHRELVLTGVDLGDYGAGLVPRPTLAALVGDLASVPGLRWVRLSSVLPAYFTPALVEAVTRSALVASHLHVPLQSGSDRVLRRMRRPYTIARYRDLVERLAAGIPALGLGTDVIVGFPGETAADFDATVALVEALPFSYLHVFPYSPRRGTEAAGHEGRVDDRVVARRSRVLRELGRAKNLAFRRALVGRTLEVLVLERRDPATGGLIGLTGNYVEVVFGGPDALMRRLAHVRVTAADAGRTAGQLDGEGDGRPLREARGA